MLFWLATSPFLSLSLSFYIILTYNSKSISLSLSLLLSRSLILSISSGISSLVPITRALEQQECECKTRLANQTTRPDSRHIHTPVLSRWQNVVIRLFSHIANITYIFSFLKFLGHYSHTFVAYCSKI